MEPEQPTVNIPPETGLANVPPKRNRKPKKDTTKNDKPAPKKEKIAVPTTAYLRLQWVGASDGKERVLVAATGYAKDEREWENLKACTFDEMEDYLNNDGMRRADAKNKRKDAVKLEAARKKEADAKAEREALEAKVGGQ